MSTSTELHHEFSKLRADLGLSDEELWCLILDCSLPRFTNKRFPSLEQNAFQRGKVSASTQAKTRLVTNLILIGQFPRIHERLMRVSRQHLGSIVFYYFPDICEPLSWGAAFSCQTSIKILHSQSDNGANGGWPHLLKKEMGQNSLEFSVTNKHLI